MIRNQGRDSTVEPAYLAEVGGKKGGTSNYSELENKPKINNIELDGNKTWEDLGLVNPMHIAGRVDTEGELPSNASVGDVYLVGLTNAEKTEYVYTTGGWEFVGTATTPVDNELSTESENPVQNKIITGALNGKQATIDGNNKLSADLINDANSTNKFTTASEKNTWNGKQDALTFDEYPVENSTNPITSGGVYSVIGDINNVLEEML